MGRSISEYQTVGSSTGGIFISITRIGIRFLP